MIFFSKTVDLYKPKETKEIHDIVTKYEKISIQGTKHSQGGQSKNPNKDKKIQAAAIDLKKFNKIELIDKTNLNVTVQAGVKWKDLIKELNKKGLSPIVTQSDYDFAIGGALATNVHGWQAKSGPLISTMNSFQLINADGKKITCSETENPDIFNAAIGGYGLFGIITKVNLKITKNWSYQTHSSTIKTEDFITTFDQDVLKKNETEMFYARLDVSDKNFLKNTIFNSYEKVGSCQAIEKSKMTNLKIKQFIINLIFFISDF